ncbi:MAG: hypothetical protein M3R39_05580 [Actinomycetota bacterium]|nr:hypothetical protein [Actinomycetota bacterium]
MRLVALLPLALALAACGSSAPLVKRPQGRAPGSGGNVPPPAWIETDTGSH